MNFFAAQDQAHKLSRRLLWLLGCAVLAIVGAVNALVLLILEWGRDPQLLQGSIWSRNSDVILFVSAAVMAGVALASLTRIVQLRGGGGVVARGMGATLISMDSPRAEHRRLCNVVQEMAIASGVPVPEIYLLEHEDAINAFAAGYAPSDAAITVTRGALEQLTRAELQGVVAHEFSHVLNGDMRLNIRLMGLLFGILSIGLLGRTLLRGGGSGRGAGGLKLFALGLTIIGYVGLFFGRLIQAAVSRQREWLADASAVQFTRDPEGIAGALERIAASPAGAQLDTSNAEEVSHMLFEDGRPRSLWFRGLLATHPPLLDRIKRLNARPGARSKARLGAGLAADAADSAVVDSGLSGGAVNRHGAEPVPGFASREASQAGLVQGGRVQAIHLDAAGVARQIANPAADDVVTAVATIESLPPTLASAAQGPDRALELLLLLALDPQADVRQRQLDVIERLQGSACRGRVFEMFEEAEGVHPMHRLPLAAMAFPALRRISLAAVERVLDTLYAMSHVDEKIHLHEYCLCTLLLQQLRDMQSPNKVRVQGKRKLAECREHINALLAILAEVGHEDKSATASAFEMAQLELFTGVADSYLPPPDWVAALDAALPALDQLNGGSKVLLVQAMVKVIASDNRVRVAEVELLRTLCAALHCPLPPLHAH